MKARESSSRRENPVKLSDSKLKGLKRSVGVHFPFCFLSHNESFVENALP